MSDRPQEVRKMFVLANFRPLYKSEPAPRERARDRRPGMSAIHLVRLRRLQCIVAGCSARADLEAHHLKSGPARTERGLGLKATDRYALPMCWRHHNEVENLGSRREYGYFYDGSGIDPYFASARLWERSSRCKSRGDAKEERCIDDMLALVHRLKIEGARQRHLREETARATAAACGEARR